MTTWLKMYPLRAAATMPTYATPGSAGMDLYAAIEQPYTLQPRQRISIPIGWAFAIPEGYEGQIRPRSGLAARFGVTSIPAIGTIDSDYRGEVCVPLINHGDKEFIIEPGMRIAQMVVSPVAQRMMKIVSNRAELGDTERGENGFGSTGH